MRNIRSFGALILKRISIGILLSLFLGLGLSDGRAADLEYASLPSLKTSLQDPDFQKRLDYLTASPRTWNKVELLHLGKTSRPRRISEIAAAKYFAFQSLPYWFDDHSTEIMLSAYQSKMLEDPHFEFRFIFDWTSPAFTGDMFQQMQYNDLKLLSKGKLVYWNDPLWFKPWSLQFWRNNLHEKLLIIDGKKLITGGMNASDEYFMGGETATGWHDTDVIVEGPIAKEAMDLFLRIYHLSKHFKKFGRFSSDEQEMIFQIRAWLRPYLYSSEETDNSFREYGLSQRYEKEWDALNEKIGPIPEHKTDGDAARFIYTNSLIDRNLKTDEPESRIYNILVEMLPHAKKTVRIFLPYLSISDQMRNLLAETAARGITLELITNSLRSHDVGKIPYLVSVSNYLPLLEAGVKIYEWQGHQDLEAIEAANDCKIKDWPGRTIHTKAILIDDDLTLIGAHNFNIRSEFYNTESAVMIEGENFNRQMQAVFDQDLDRAEPRKVQCDQEWYARPKKVKLVDLDEMRKYVDDNAFEISIAKLFESLM